MLLQFTSSCTSLYGRNLIELNPKRVYLEGECFEHGVLRNLLVSHGIYFDKVLGSGVEASDVKQRGICTYVDDKFLALGIKKLEKDAPCLNILLLLFSVG